MRKNDYKMTRQQWEVYRERCRISDPRQPPKVSEHTVEDALPELMKKLGLETSLWVETLSRDWQEIVGTGVGKHTRPGRLDGKTLFVFVDSPVWLNELKRYGQKQMLENLRQRFGTARIARLVVQLDPDR